MWYVTLPSKRAPTSSTFSTLTRKSDNSCVRPARSAARACQAASAWNSSGYSSFTIAAHDPEGVTTGRPLSKAPMVCRARSRASSWKPLLKWGWPQQVCAAGKSTVTPSRRNSRTVATPTSGKRASPRHVTISETFTHPPRLQQPPSLVDQSLIDEPHRPVCQRVEIVPRMPPDLGREVDLVSDPQRGEFLVQPVVAAIPRVVGI